MANELTINANIANSYKTLAKTVYQFTKSDALQSEILDFSDTVEIVEQAIISFQLQVKNHTRGENRALLNYKISCIIDEFNCQSVEIYSDKFTPLSKCLNNDVMEILEFTRAKNLYTAGITLVNALRNYDEQYKNITAQLQKAAKLC